MEWMFMPLRRYADFSGRSRRMEFWMWQVFQIIVYVGVLIVAMMLGGSALMTGDPTAMAAAGGGMILVMLAYGIYCLAVFIPTIAVAVRRLHDTNRTGWWILAPLAPYLLMVVAGALAVSAPDMAAVAGIIVLVSILAVVGLGLTLLVFYFLEGTQGPNKYGPSPKNQVEASVFS